MSGLKTAGCCVHVATLIYYLTYCIHTDFIKLPGKHLNSIFVDLGEFEQSNQPRYVRGTRGRKESSSGSEVSDISIDNSESDNDYPPSENNMNLSENSNLPEQKPLDSQIEKQKSENIGENISPDESIEHFTSHIPNIGATINYNSETNITVTHTNLIDNFLFAFWSLSKLFASFQANMPKLEQTQTLIEIIKNIDNYNWNKAKELWIVRAMNFKQKPIKKNISLYGTEYSRFISYLSNYQLHQLFQLCSLSCSRNNLLISSTKDHIYLKKTNESVDLYSAIDGNCKECKSEIRCDIRFINNPNFLFIESENNNIFVNDIPKEIFIQNTIFQFLCVTVISKKKDYFCIFEITKNLYVVDNLNKKVLHLKSFDQLQNTRRQRTNIDYYQLPISVALYFKSDRNNMLSNSEFTQPTSKPSPSEKIAPQLPTMVQFPQPLNPPDTEQIHFRIHIPQWGARILYCKIPNTFVSNTCSIDYYLLAMWVLSKLNPNFTINLPNLPQTQFLLNIITHIENLNWDMARQIWIVNIMKYSKKSNKDTGEISMFGSESEKFFQYLAEYQKHEFLKKCNPHCLENGQPLKHLNRQQRNRESNVLHFERDYNDIISLQQIMPDTVNCLSCSEQVSIDRRFINNPLFLFIYDDVSPTLINDLPKEITIDNKIYKLLCAHAYKADSRHFVCFFEFDNTIYLVDDIGKKCELLPTTNTSIRQREIYNLPITSCFYYLIQPPLLLQQPQEIVK